MSSSEEAVVDQQVEAAWLQFRVRLADHLVALGEGDEVILRAEATGEVRTPQLRFTADDDSVSFGLIFTMHGDDRVRHKQRVMRTLRSLGMRSGRLTCDRSEVDRVANAAATVLRDVFSIIHPVFVTVHAGDLVLAPASTAPPRAAAAQADDPLPLVVEPQSYEELCDWVDRVIAPFATKGERERGAFIPLRGNRVQAWVHVATSEPVVEVWAHMASDIDLAKTQRRLSELTTSQRAFRFLIQKDRLYAVATIPADPLAPRHLSRAVVRAASLSRTLGPELAKELAPDPTTGKPESGVRVVPRRASRLDPALAAMLGATDLDPAELVALAVTLGGGDADRLAALKDVAARSYATSAGACETAENADELELGRLHYRAKCRWHRVMKALREACEANQEQESAS